MTSKESMKHVCKPGYWMENIAKLGDAPNWVEVVAPIPENDNIFGYEKNAFLAKQYE